MIDSSCVNHLRTAKHSATVANGIKVNMYGPGTVLLKQVDGTLLSIHIKLEDVWYAPQASNRLLSVTAMMNHGYHCEITSKGSSIWDKRGQEVIWATASSSSNNLHWFQSALITPVIESIASLVNQQSYSIWHQRFGHTSCNALCHAYTQLSGVPLLKISPSYPPCHGCLIGKMLDHPFPSSSKHASHPLALVHTDLVGPFSVEPYSCAQYILTFIDDYMGYALVAFLQVKLATKLHFQNMVSWAKTFTGHQLASVCSDQGGEFMSHEFQVFLSSRGMTHQTSISHMPQQNGRAKRFNRTILEKAEAMCHRACLPKAFWQDAVETSVHLYNRQPMYHHDWKTLIELFKRDGKKPDVSYFQVFGCKAYVFIPPEQ